jgi:hypothetical protein
MTKSVLITAAAAAALLATPAAAAMTVGTFLARANALKAQGPMALMSPDFTVLRGEAQAATAQLKAERAARRTKGLKPVACIPEGQSIGITEMLDGLAALSPAEQKLPLKDCYQRVLAKRYPC